MLKIVIRNKQKNIVIKCEKIVFNFFSLLAELFELLGGNVPKNMQNKILKNYKDT